MVWECSHFSQTTKEEHHQKLLWNRKELTWTGLYQSSQSLPSNQPVWQCKSGITLSQKESFHLFPQLTEGSTDSCATASHLRMDAPAAVCQAVRWLRATRATRVPSCNMYTAHVWISDGHLQEAFPKVGNRF